MDYDKSEKTCKNIVYEEPYGSQRLRCETCITIKAAVQQLNELVFREPWLLTEGMAGAPVKTGWEEDKDEKAVDDRYGDGYTAEERERVRADAGAAVMRRWGLMRTQQREGEKRGGKAPVVEVLEGQEESE